jgi:hypothetical protein
MDMGGGQRCETYHDVMYFYLLCFLGVTRQCGIYQLECEVSEGKVIISRKNETNTR